ncbi:MAG: four helix bundle protein [Sphingobacteriales bacterium]|nr:four helix bundle protein [Sphingobacteriales bacterium]
MTGIELQSRLKQFAYRIIPLCESLPSKKVSRVIEDQLTRSVFSAAANYRAACNAQSPKAFTSKLSIAFEEMDESLFWLEVITEIKLVKQEKMKSILKEADELTRILASSRKTSQKKRKI